MARVFVSAFVGIITDIHIVHHMYKGDEVGE